MISAEMGTTIHQPNNRKSGKNKGTSQGTSTNQKVSTFDLLLACLCFILPIPNQWLKLDKNYTAVLTIEQVPLLYPSPPVIILASPHEDLLIVFKVNP